MKLEWSDILNLVISAIGTKGSKISRKELVNSLKTAGYNIYILGRKSNDLLHPDYEKYNVKYLSSSIERVNINPLKELNTIKEIKQVFEENNIDALLVYGIRTFPTMVIAARLARVKRIVCIVNGSGRLFRLGGLKGLIIKFISYPMLWLAFLMADDILFQNPDDMNMIKCKGMLWRKNYGLVNGSGVNLDKYISDNLEPKPVFSMISRLTGSKGVNEYIQAACTVKQLYPEAIFNLIGPIEDNDSSINMDELKNAVDKKIVVLRGKVDDVRPFIDKCRIFVLPSYYPEGVPRSILEAMAMGRPIITTDSSGCRETVINGVNGFLVTPKDSEDLAKKMIWMINNPEQAEKMGKESRKICETKFNINKVNKIILETMGI